MCFHYKTDNTKQLKREGQFYRIFPNTSTTDAISELKKYNTIVTNH